MFPIEGEEPTQFSRRRTCRSTTCKKLVRSEGPQFPMWREEAAVSPSLPVAAPRVISEAVLAAVRIPAWLQTPVENSVEKPVNN